MIRPTMRAVLLFAAGVPLGLVVVSIAPTAWIFAANYAVLVLLAIATDALLACRPRRLIVGIETPDRLFIGEAGGITATIEAPGHRRRTRLDLLAEQSGELDPPILVAVDLAVRSLPRHNQHILDGIGVFVAQAYENDVRPWRQPADWKV